MKPVGSQLVGRDCLGLRPAFREQLAQTEQSTKTQIFRLAWWTCTLFFCLFCFLWWKVSECGRKYVCVNPDIGCQVSDWVFMCSSSAFIRAPSGRSLWWELQHCWNVLLAPGEYVCYHALFALWDLSNQSAVTQRQQHLTGSVRMERDRVVLCFLFWGTYSKAGFSPSDVLYSWIVAYLCNSIYYNVLCYYCHIYMIFFFLSLTLTSCPLLVSCSHSDLTPQ